MAVPAQLTFLTINDLAAAMKISKQTVRRMYERGQFPEPLRFGRRLRWPSSVLEDLAKKEVGKICAQGTK